jgi:hypothetical protein
MQRVMKEALTELETIQLGHPLASQDLAAVLDGVAMRMMQDVPGWARLFRVIVETVQDSAATLATIPPSIFNRPGPPPVEEGGREREEQCYS